MNTRKTEKTTNSRLFNKNILATAVATAMFGGSVGTAYATQGSNSYTDFLIAFDTTIDNSTSNATSNYIVSGNNTLTFNGTSGSMGHYYGNFTGSTLGTTPVLGENGIGNFVVGGNVTLHGNVGLTATSSGNGTGNWTLNSGNTLTLSENVTVFNAQNMTLNEHTILNLGNNATTGVNRDSDHALSYFGNISMASNSTINVGNGTTINGLIYGQSAGRGTLNILGNFTHDRAIGYNSTVDVKDSWGLEQINITAGNTFTMSKNVTTTNMDINGTVTATGNITADITMGASSVLNLNTMSSPTSGADSQSANVTGTIQSGSIGNAQGTLNINGTWATQGAIGQGGRGLSAINIATGANASTAYTTTFAHSVNATTITMGTSTSNDNSTLVTSLSGGQGSEIIITGKIEGSSNSSAAGILDINGDTTVTGTIGATNKLGNIIIATGTTLTINSSVTSDNITFESAGGTATLQVNGTSTITAVIDGVEGLTGAGLISINNDANATFIGAIGSQRSIDYITITDNATMNISSDVDVDDQIIVLGDLNITGAVSINATDTGTNGYGVVIGNATQGKINSSLKVTDTVTFDTATSTKRAIQFNNATLVVDGTHSSHASGTTAYIDLSDSGTVGSNSTLNIQGNFTVQVDSTTASFTEGQNIYIAGNGTVNIQSGSNVTVLSKSAQGIMNFSINNNTIGYGANATSLIVTTNYKTSSDLGLSGNSKNVWNSYIGRSSSLSCTYIF